MPVELKPVQHGDAEIMFDAWGRYPENFRYLTARVFSAPADAERYLVELIANPDSLAFHIADTGGNVVGLVKAIVAGHRAQVGYVIHKPFWGRGFATLAVQELTAILQSQPPILRIWATCALDNSASIRVPEKCGFEREALLRNWVMYPAQGDQPFDNYSYVRPSSDGQSPSLGSRSGKT